MARRKPTPHIVESREQAEGTMAEVAAIDRKLKALKITLNEEIAAAKEKAARNAAPLEVRRKELESGLAVFATLNRKMLFPDGTKSLDLGFGIIGFRASSKIVQQNNISAAVTLERLHQFGFLEGIRTKEEINRDAMTDWTTEKLETVGLRRQKSDGFFVEVKEDPLPTA